MQNHFKTKKKHKEAKDKTSTGQDVGKAGRTTKKRGKEGGKQAEYFSASPKERGERGRSGQSYSERTWGEQGEYFSASPKERQTKGERKAQSANRERRRTKRLLKDYQKARRVLFKRRLRQLKRSNEAKRKARAQQVFYTARSPSLQRLCYYGSFSMLLVLNNNAVRPQKQCYKNDKEGGARKSPVLSRK